MDNFLRFFGDSICTAGVRRLRVAEVVAFVGESGARQRGACVPAFFLGERRGGVTALTESESVELCESESSSEPWVRDTLHVMKAHQSG